MPNKTNHSKPRPKHEIVKELQESELARARLAQDAVQAKRGPELADELKAWESQNQWPQRQAKALQDAQAAARAIREAEKELGESLDVIEQNPMWGAVATLVKISTLRGDLVEAIKRYHQIDYEKAVAARGEVVGEVTFTDAKSLAGVASDTAITAKLLELDPGGTDVLRSVPPGRKRAIARILLDFAFREPRRPQPLDTQNRK